MRAGWGVVLPLISFLACSSDGSDTRIVLVVGSDYMVPTELDTISLHIKGPGKPRTMEFALTAVDEPGKKRLPLAVDLVPAENKAESFSLQLMGLCCTLPLVTQEARLSFLPGESRVLPVFLGRACGAVACDADHTCLGGRCAKLVDIDTSTLPGYDPAHLPIPSGPDGGVRARDGAAADSLSDLVATDSRAKAPDGRAGDVLPDVPGDRGGEVAEVTMDSHADGGRADGGDRPTDAAGTTSDAGRDVKVQEDIAVDAREAGRDAGGAEVQAAPDAARDATGVPDGGLFLVRGRPQKWHITSTVTVEHPNATLTKLVVVLPAPQSNPYQDVTNLEQGTGTLLAIPNSDDFYVRFSSSGVMPAPSSMVSYALSYDVTLYDLSVDLSQVKSVPPYDTAAADYVRNTGPRGVYVDPDNATIAAIADSLAVGDPDVLTFAEAAYEYVASHYQYLSSNTGLHPLAEILAAGGGDCGNLTSIYVSLLRHRGIPARHLVSVRPDGTYHVWADFLLEGYGWVPVDVTYKQADRAGDYFGKVALGGNGIIMDKQVWLALDIDGSTTEIALLQNYAWWFWSSTPSPAVTASYALASAAK